LIPLGWLDEFLERNALNIALALLAIFVALAVILPYSVYTVRAGDVAVIWSRFGGGTVTDRVYPEGTHLKWPWNIVYIYNARTQADTWDYQALSSDGVNVVAEVSFLYNIVEVDTGLLHKYVGPNYLNVVVRPAVGAALRTVISRFPTDALYSEQRDAIQLQVVNAINSQGAGVVAAGGRTVHMIMLSNVLLRRVTLPNDLQLAIDRKMVQRQVALEWNYRIERERLEAERKRVEATGIRDFQQIVGANLTDPYLRWLGIDATLRLAQSPGSRLVIVGGRDGMPLILNPPGGLDPAGASLGQSSLGQSSLGHASQNAPASPGEGGGAEPGAPTGPGNGGGPEPGAPESSAPEPGAPGSTAPGGITVGPPASRGALPVTPDTGITVPFPHEISPNAPTSH
jgi:regulator of protease activity HflC (stomatin/prohibitin superfamily)